MKTLGILATALLLFTACRDGHKPVKEGATSSQAPHPLKFGFEIKHNKPSGPLDSPNSDVTFFISGAKDYALKKNVQGYCEPSVVTQSSSSAFCFHAGVKTLLSVELKNHSLLYGISTFFEDGATEWERIAELSIPQRSYSKVSVSSKIVENESTMFEK